MTKPLTKKSGKKLGAPSKYKTEYCQGLIDHMKQGLSFETYAAVLDINRDTLYEWAKVHPAFSDAKSRGKLHSQYMWEKMGVALAAGKLHGNSAAWKMNMENRFKWSEKKTTDVNVRSIEQIIREIETEEAKGA